MFLDQGEIARAGFPDSVENVAQKHDHAGQKVNQKVVVGCWIVSVVLAILAARSIEVR